MAMVSPVDTAQELAGFCRSEHPRLVGTLSLYTGDADLAEELAQEALVRVCQHWSRVGRLESPGGWAHRVAINLANSSFRSRAAKQRATARLQAAQTDPDSIDVTDAVAVRRAVAALPDRQRTALVLRYFADFPVSEVAGLMGCPEGTVKTLTFEAIRSLRRAGLAVTE
jgi:RNA polymerase sigma-70 factor (sigma-E family)